jgi:hypothetical protein
MAAEQTIRDHPELFAIVTPIKADRLEELLVTHPNRPLVESVVVGFREGFWPFAGIEPEGYPSVWEEANHRLTPEQEDFLGKQIAEEESVGRYSAPFGPDLLPGMYSMPLGAVPKTDSGDFRTINDQSAGDFSLNSLVNPDDTHIRLDTVKDLCHNLVVHRRTHSHIPLWLFKSDVSKAYRRLPLAFHWQIKQVVSFRGRRWIDRCVCFGGRGSPKTWCAFMSLVLWIAIEVMEIDALLAYMDDAFSYDECKTFIPYPPYETLFPAKQARFLFLLDDLGIPHDKKKQIFGRNLIVIGLDIDPNVMTLRLPLESKGKLVKSLRDFVADPPSRRHPLREWQSMLGYGNWGLNVLPLAKPGLSSSYSKIAGKKIPQAQIFINAEVKRDLTWLADRFEESSGVRVLRADVWSLPSEADIILYGDAATSGGLAFWEPSRNVGFVCDRANAPHGTDTIFWFEALTTLSALHWAVSLSPRPHRVLIYSDSLNTVQIFDSWKASGHYNSILLSAAEILMSHDVDLRVHHIAGERNVVADALSRSMFNVANQYAPGIRVHQFQPPRLTLGAEKK